MNVKTLRDAMADLDDDMIVLLRVQNKDGDEQFMCSPSSAIADAGCTDTECFVIDGADGECEHGVDAAECETCVREAREQ